MYRLYVSHAFTYKHTFGGQIAHVDNARALGQKYRRAHSRGGSQPRISSSRFLRVCVVVVVGIKSLT